jgi:hypothetical protein
MIRCGKEIPKKYVTVLCTKNNYQFSFQLTRFHFRPARFCFRLPGVLIIGPQAPLESFGAVLKGQSWSRKMMTNIRDWPSQIFLSISLGFARSGADVGRAGYETI